VLPFCQKYEVATICWAPLARGRLAGTYTRGGRKIPDGNLVQSTKQNRLPTSQWPVMEAVDKMADAKGISSSQFSIAWCLQVPGVTCPIIGPRTLDQLERQHGRIERDIDDAELKTVDELNPPGELCRDRNLGAVPR